MKVSTIKVQLKALLKERAERKQRDAIAAERNRPRTNEEIAQYIAALTFRRKLMQRPKDFCVPPFTANELRVLEIVEQARARQLAS